MSADNGYIIRKNKRGKFVLQMYFASNDSYPELPENPAKAAMFDTLDEAIQFYNDRQFDRDCEYGLSIDVPHEEEPTMEKIPYIESYTRRPFDVEAVRVTAENMLLLTGWTRGKVNEGGVGKPYIEIDTKRPTTERQKRAYVGDWILYAQGGFKIYTDSAFHKNFVKVEPKEVPMNITHVTVNNPLDNPHITLLATAMVKKLEGEDLTNEELVALQDALRGK